MGLDTSDAVGADDIGLVIRNYSTGEVVAAGDYNDTNVIHFADWLCSLLIRYPTLFIIPERRSTGTSIIDYMLKLLPPKGIDPFKRIFNWVVHEADVNPKDFEEVFGRSTLNRDEDKYVKYRKYFGFATSRGGRSDRNQLYGQTLVNAAKHTGSVVRDPKLIKQLNGLVERNGRIDHEAGEHDDLAIGWMLSYWFLVFGNNKKHYIMRDSKPLSAILDNMTHSVDGAQKLKELEQEELRKTINFLLERLKEETNEIKMHKIVAKIKFFYKDIDPTIVKGFDIESYLEEIKLLKRKGIMSNLL
jgi:hypothetical protein